MTYLPKMSPDCPRLRPRTQLVSVALHGAAACLWALFCELRRGLGIVPRPGTGMKLVQETRATWFGKVAVWPTGWPLVGLGCYRPQAQIERNAPAAREDRARVASHNWCAGGVARQPWPG
jgi:hypothetical protein